MTTPRPDPDPIAAADSTPGNPAAGLEERPGVLRGGVTLTLQTRQAQRLVKGRGYTAEKPAIIGLLGFANLLRLIWLGARADDPYADWWMLKVHGALEDAREQIQGAEQAMTARVQAIEAIDVKAPTSVKPVRVALNFSNPYAFLGARLLSLYDGLVRTSLSARHVGLVTREEAERALHLGARQVRRAYLSPQGYRLTGVSRRDIDQGTARALQACEAMGELPAEVLSGERRAPHGPSAVILTPSEGTKHLSLRPLPASL